MPRPPSEPADVCLVLEGTYPYISGGVSTWVHQIISALPDVRFALFFLGANRAATGAKKYELPPNIVALEELYLFDPLPRSERTPGKPLPAVREKVYDQLRGFFSRDDTEEPTERFLDLTRAIAASAPTLTCANLWQDREARAIIESVYRQHMPDESFLNYFWSSRFLVEPAWKLIRATDRIPKARVYHSLCTGYAGLAASIAASNNRAFYLLSEHGIYMKERIGEIQNARWMHEVPPRWAATFQDLSSFKRLWVEFFRLLGQISYDSAHQITSLFENNKRLQVEFGAIPEKVEIIPNGIHPHEFDSVVATREAIIKAHPKRQAVGFLGRVVRIKDVKTLLRASRLVVDECPEVDIIIAGPTDEDPDYYAACEELLAQLNLTRNVRFVGLRKRDELLAEIDVMVLTSVSEGLPFVILEAFAARVPVVSTDVGACRELIEGMPGESPHLGSAGAVTGVAQPAEIARALVRILKDPKLRAEMGEAGRRRAEDHYEQEKVIARYAELYASSIS
jgi:glycosyltransferase involved in cell wall biosynthesis